MRKRVLLIFLAGVSVLLPGYLWGQGADSPFGASQEAMRPELIWPTTEVVDIKNESGIEFRWKPRGRSRGFIFAIYEGFEMYDENLLCKERLSAGKNKIFLEKGRFANGRTYTWTIRQKNDSSKWSDKSYYAFTVVY